MSETGSKPLVLHLTVDYPNVYRPENTPAVRSFVKSCEAVDHCVIALTRTANPLRAAVADGDGKGDSKVVSMRYWGLPFGIFLALSMYIVSHRVSGELKRRGIAPKMVHAHKLTFEGLAGWFLARRMALPLVVSVRGEAESKVLRFKPHYRPLLQRVLSDARHVYFVSAWFKPLLNRYFRVSAEKQSLLPNFVVTRDPVDSPRPNLARLLSVLDLNVYRKKGLDRLLPAFRDCLKAYPEAHLDIIGRGQPVVVLEVQYLIEQLGIARHVSLLGTMSNDELLSRLPTYSGMALPSHNETFGMIYVEALLAGVPILHSRGTGIDGFVDFVEARVVVDPMSTESIRDGLDQLIKNSAVFQAWLISHRNLVLSKFDKKFYVDKYRELVDGF